MTRKNIILLLLIIFLGLLLRVYRVLDFPVQLNHDEISQLYDAISVSQTAKDVYGNFLPTMFESVHDFKSPFYTYATVMFIFMFGSGEMAIKMPGIFFGVLIIPAIFWLTLKLFKSFTISHLAAFITAVSPFEIFFSRKSFENGAGIFFMLIGFSALMTYLERKNKLSWFYLGLFMLALGMYTYFSHAIIIPLLLGVFIVIFRKEFTKISLKKYVIPGIVFSALLIPLALIILFNPGSRYRSQTVFVGQDINLGKRIEYIGKDNNLANTILTYKTNFDFVFNRYLDQFNPNYLFLDGLDFTNQSPLGMGPMFLFQLPFLILGIVFIVKRVNLSIGAFILAWVVIGTLPSGLTFESHSPHRIIMVFTMLNIISVVGVYRSLEYLKRIRKINLVLSAVTGLAFGSLFILNFVYFIHMYFVNLPFEKSQYIHYPFKQVAQYAWTQHGNFQQIVFDPLYGEFAPVIGTAAHYYIAYYGKYPPAQFQREYRFGEKEREVLFDKFSIRKFDWRADQNMKNTLVIASPWSLPIKDIKKENILKVFYYYDGTPAFYAIKLE